MTKKKLLSIILAVTLVCAITVTGSYAYLSNTANEVTNNFTAAAPGLIDKPEPPTPTNDPYGFGLALLEHKVTARSDEKDKDGNNVAIDTTATTDAYVLGNDYTFLPGDAGVKDPTVYISKEKKTNIPAYLYITVSGCETGDNAVVQTSVDAGNWQLLGTTADGKAVYVYVKDNQPVQITKENVPVGGLAVSVLTGNKYTVNENITEEQLQDLADPASAKKITIKAYLVQAYETEKSLAEVLTDAFGEVGTITATQP